MKHLLTGVAVAAALAIAAPGWAQNAGGNTHDGNSIGTPGPNPGGPSVPSRYAGRDALFAQMSTAPAPSATQPGRMPQGGKKTSSRGGNLPPPAADSTMTPTSTSAMPPTHHAVRHAHAMHHFHKGMAEKAASTGDTTAQLNRQELARLQTGNQGMPAPGPAMPESSPGPEGSPKNLPGPPSH
jgi:hypothetical protein